MKFKFVHKNTRDTYSYDEICIATPGHVVGLQIKGTRPQTVELTQRELQELLNNPEYASTVVCALAYTR